MCIYIFKLLRPKLLKFYFTTLERADLIDMLLPPGAHQTEFPSKAESVAPTQVFDVKLTKVS
jgi:hypothetical protein